MVSARLSQSPAWLRADCRRWKAPSTCASDKARLCASLLSPGLLSMPAIASSSTWNTLPVVLGAMSIASAFCGVPCTITDMPSNWIAAPSVYGWPLATVALVVVLTTS